MYGTTDDLNNDSWKGNDPLGGSVKARAYKTSGSYTTAGKLSDYGYPSQSTGIIKFKITNNTQFDLTAILFGHNHFLMRTNFGSATGLKVEAVGFDYIKLLSHSATKPFMLHNIEFENKYEKRKKFATLTANDAIGQQCSIPVMCNEQWHNYNTKIDGTTHISISVPKGVSTVTLHTSGNEFARQPFYKTEIELTFEQKILLIL